MSSLKLLKYVLFFFNLLFWVSVSLLSVAELTSSQLHSTSFLYQRASCGGQFMHARAMCSITGLKKKGIILSSSLPILPQYKLAKLKCTSAVIYGDALSLSGGFRLLLLATDIYWWGTWNYILCTECLFFSSFYVPPGPLGRIADWKGSHLFWGGLAIKFQVQDELVLTFLWEDS